LDKRNKILNILKIIWGVAVVAGGIYYVAKNYSTAIQYLSSISPFKLLLAGFFIILVRLMNVDLVQQSLVLIGWKPNFKNAFNFVSISQLGKYIPGGVWQFVARFEAYKEANITYKNMGKAFIVENIWMVAGSFFVSLAFILFSQPVALLANYGFSMAPMLYNLLGWICLLLWIVSIVITERVMLGKNGRVDLKRVVYLFCTQTCLWIFLGVSFFCLFSQTGSLSDLFFTIGGFGLSFLAGYVVIIAPGGIGVREAVAVLLFSLMFSSAEIGIYTIVHRLLYTIAEFLLAGIALLLTRKKKAAAQPSLEDSKSIK
jgi:uncharacterized membrane protein YbhN (UPF0104 family)